MNSKKIFSIWLVISLLSGGAFYLLKTMFSNHPLWSRAVPFMYIGVLILFAMVVLNRKKD